VTFKRRCLNVVTTSNFVVIATSSAQWVGIIFRTEVSIKILATDYRFSFEREDCRIYIVGWTDISCSNDLY